MGDDSAADEFNVREAKTIVEPSEPIAIRIFVPELNIQKCLQFLPDVIVWDVKQQCLAAIPKELKESFNYGLFYPPSNGRAGKFLDEERPISDYPFPGRIGYLELKYKRRVYKMLNLDEKQLRVLHTRVNLRKFLDYVMSGNAEKVTKMCAKGLDPNFHCPETGETPLTLAGVTAKPTALLSALVGGGALLDYRTRCGSTALHRASEKDNIEAVRTLLDLGASPNCRDGKGASPLYNAVLVSAAPMLCEALLHDYSVHGVQDAQGWHEVHQACRNGLAQHLEHLLFYGADINSRNASGNTPLHVCAVNNQEACARLLLFRGADKEALNYANQTPYQVAVIAGNLELAALIHRHGADDVVSFKETPSYNPKRRKSGSCFVRKASSTSLRMPTSTSFSNLPLPSPSLSSSSSTTSTISGGVRVLPALPPASPAGSPADRWLNHGQLSVSSMSVRSESGSSSSCTVDSEDNASAAGSVHLGKSPARSINRIPSRATVNKSGVDHCDVMSESSGVGTSSSGSAGSYDATPTGDSFDHSVPAPMTLLMPGRMVTVVENYASTEQGHLQLRLGDTVKVTGSTDCGLVEGTLRGKSGLFPSFCIQEVQLRYPSKDSTASPESSTPHTRNSLSVYSDPGLLIKDRVVGRRELVAQSYGTTPRWKAPSFGEPRTVFLRKGQKSFGFVLRGAKATSPVLKLPAGDNRIPAMQYLDSVEAGSVADRAGLKAGDFLLNINGENVSQASHESVVEIIRNSGELVSITVCSLPDYSLAEGEKPDHSRQCLTLPRKLPGGRPPLPPQRDPRTTLSVGKARARSVVSGLMELESLHKDGGDVFYNQKEEARTATIRPKSNYAKSMVSARSRLPGLESEASVTPRPPRVYASVSEMKRLRHIKQAHELLKLHKEYHSSPDLNQNGHDLLTRSSSGEQTVNATTSELLDATSLAREEEHWRKSFSQNDVHDLYRTPRKSRTSWAPTGDFSLPLTATTASSFGTPALTDTYLHDHTDGDDEDEESEEENDLDDNTPVAESEQFGKPRVEGRSVASVYRKVKQCRPISLSGCNLSDSIGVHVPPPQFPPPPPPPPSQVVKVDVSKAQSEYATLGIRVSEGSDMPVMSSFRPTDNAKLYASPDECKTIGYMSVRNSAPGSSATLRPATTSAKTVPRSHSLTLRDPRRDRQQQQSPVGTSALPRSRTCATTPPTLSMSKSNSSQFEKPEYGHPVTTKVRSVMQTSVQPLIPDPDYYESSDKDEKSDQHGRKTKGLVIMGEKGGLNDSAPQGDHHLENCCKNGRTKVSRSVEEWEGIQKINTSSVDADHIRIQVKHHPPPPLVNLQDPASMLSSMTKSRSFALDLQRARSGLKNSQSYPERFDDGLADQAPESNVHVTRISVGEEKGMRSVGQTPTYAVSGFVPYPHRPEPRCSVSIVHVTPEDAEYRTDFVIRPKAEQADHRESLDQDSVSTLSTLSSLSSSSASSDKGNLAGEGEEDLLPCPPVFRSSAHPQRGGYAAERSIEESLKLIRKHVEALSEPASSLVPPPPEFGENSSDFMPPPPFEFSDTTYGMDAANEFRGRGQVQGHGRRARGARAVEELMALRNANVRIVGSVPKRVSFSPEVFSGGDNQPTGGVHYSMKPLDEWHINDALEWLDSLSLSEYKCEFLRHGIDGQKLAGLNNQILVSLGVKRMGHRLIMEQSLKSLLHSKTNNY